MYFFGTSQNFLPKIANEVENKYQMEANFPDIRKVKIQAYTQRGEIIMKYGLGLIQGEV